VLAPLFDAIRTRLAGEKSTPTLIKIRLAAIEKLVLKIDRKSPPTALTTRATYVGAAAAGAPSEYRVNAQRLTCDPPRESARISRQILVKIPQPEEANNIKKYTNEVLLAKISQGDDAPPALSRVLAVNKLISGDIILHTANESDKAALE
jgi:hypothetical protein